MSKNKVKKHLFSIIFSAIYVALFVITTLLSSFSFDTKLSNFAQNINDYYWKHDVSVRNEAPIFQIKTQNLEYRNIFQTFYYSSEVSNFRLFGENKVPFYSPADFDERKDGIECSLHYQYSHSIGQKYSWGYYLDSGLFSAYYKDEILPNRGYLTHRFNSDGFIFISDTFADILLQKYDIASYEELISNEEYCLLECFIGNQKIRFCINNILYSTERTGGRVSDLEGVFCVYYTHRNIFEDISLVAEMDLKSDIYGTSTFLEKVYQLGYSTKNASFQFKTFDKNTNNYIVRDDLLEQYLSLDFSNYQQIYLILIVLLSSIPVLTLFLFFNEKKIRGFYFFALIFSFLILTIRCFVFVAPFYNIFLVITFSLIMLNYLRIIYFDFILKKYFDRNTPKRIEVKEQIYEIDI